MKLHDRARLTQLTLNAFQGRVFAWGTCDCARLVDFHISQFGRSSGYSKFKAYSTDAGAYKALKKAGFGDTVDWLDNLKLERLPGAAYAMVGDIAAYTLPDAGMAGLSVYVGAGRVLGFHKHTGTAIVQVEDLSIPGIKAHVWRIV